MKIHWNKNDYMLILGIDYEEDMLQVVYINEEDYDINDVKYLRKGSTVLWEDNPPTCSKCIKNNKTSCSKKCYNFVALRPSNIKAITKSHKSKQESKRQLINEELQKIKDMKNEGLDYESWLYKSLFESEDNTERMIF